MEKNATAIHDHYPLMPTPSLRLTLRTLQTPLQLSALDQDHLTLYCQNPNNVVRRTVVRRKIPKYPIATDADYWQMLEAFPPLDTQTLFHQARQAKIAEILVRKADVQAHRAPDENRYRKIRYGGLCHDVGKSGYLEYICLKLNLTEKLRRATIRKHVPLGELLASLCYAPPEVVGSIRKHQKYFNGQGPYQEYVNNNTWPLGCDPLIVEQEGVLCVADVIEAMWADRYYRPRLTAAAAVRELQARSGTQFDPLFAQLAISTIDLLHADHQRMHELHYQAEQAVSTGRVRVLVPNVEYFVREQMYGSAATNQTVATGAAEGTFLETTYTRARDVIQSTFANIHELVYQ